MRLALDGVGHRFKGQPWLFRDLSIDFLPRRTYALTGPSGSGKSTLLGVLAGWIKPKEGSVVSQDVGKVNWVFQSPHGVAKRSIADHIALPLVAKGIHRHEALREADELLERFGLGGRGESCFEELSGGEAQRLMLARAIAARPSVILIDEPTAQLDPATAKGVSDVIAELAQEGVIAIIATHDHYTRDACNEQVDLLNLAEE